MANEQTEKLQGVSETLAEKPKMLEITVKPKNRIHRWLIKRKISPSKRLFEIKPQRVINIYRIAGRSVSVDLKGITTDTDKTIAEGVAVIMDLMQRHGEDIFYIVACAIQNDHREPTAKMIQIVKNEFEVSDIFNVLFIAVSNYNISSFLNSIALIKGVNALNINEKASPTEKGG